jgi:hypothetical protein
LCKSPFRVYSAPTMSPKQIARNFPKVVDWAIKMERVCLATGQPLSDLNRQDGAAIGIRQLDTVRVVVSARLPLPTDPELRHLTAQFQLMLARTSGMIFGHGIVPKEGKYDRRVIAHELVHVLQHERLGGIEPFPSRLCPRGILPSVLSQRTTGAGSRAAGIKGLPEYRFRELL